MLKSVTLEQMIKILSLNDKIDTCFGNKLRLVEVGGTRMKAVVFDHTFIYFVPEDSVDPRTLRIFPMYEANRKNPAKYLMDRIREGGFDHNLMVAFSHNIVPDVLLQALQDDDGTAQIAAKQVADYFNAIALAKPLTVNTVV